MPRTLFVIDGHSYIYQAFFGMPALTNAEGKQVQAAYALTQLLIRLAREEKTEAWAIAMDSSAPTFRHQEYPDYKADRPGMPDELRAQMPWIQEIITGFRIPVLRHDGYEADDLVASLARRAADEGYDVRIVSRDKDLEQILSERIRIWDPKDGSVYGPAELLAKKGLTPDRVVEYLALIGDTSDNVPGVAGIGPKTALKILAAVDDVEDALSESPPETIPAAALKKIRAAANQLRLSRRLVKLRTDLEVETDPAFYARSGIAAETLRPVLRKLGFQKFLGQLDELRTDESLPPSRSGAEAPTRAREEEVRLVDSEATLMELLQRGRERGRLAVHVEVVTRPSGSSRNLGLALAMEEGTAYFVPFEPVPPKPFLPPEEILDRLRAVLEDPSIGKSGHDLKRVARRLRRNGIRLEGIVGDAMLAAYVAQPTRGNYALDALCEEHLQHTLGATASSPASALKQADLFADARDEPGGRPPPDLEATARRAGERVDYALRLAGALEEEIDLHGVRRVLEELEIPLVPVLVEMEEAGIRLDPRPLQILEKEVTRTLDLREREIYEQVGEEFNINSPKQLAHILFEKLSLPRGRRTKTGFSTSADVLEELAVAHPDNPLPALILDYRALTKLRSTYLDTLPRLVDRETGRIHTDYSQTTAATGRLASSDPNLQNIPVRTEIGRRIREAFVPSRPGHVFLSADYSQVELRLLAHISEDEHLIAVLAGGRDIHREVAARVHGIAAEAVDSRQRSAAKAVNFGVIYGMGAFGLARDLGISRAEAKRFIDSFFAEFPGVRQFVDRTVEGARERGEVRTLYGRRRPLPDIRARMPGRRQRAEREAVNTVIQGSAADLIKKAMIDVHRNLSELGAPARILLQIHDELLLETSREQVVELVPRLKQWMESVLTLRVPLVVNISTGDDWFHASK